MNISKVTTLFSKSGIKKIAKKVKNTAIATTIIAAPSGMTSCRALYIPMKDVAPYRTVVIHKAPKVSPQPPAIYYHPSLSHARPTLPPQAPAKRPNTNHSTGRSGRK